MRYAFVPLGGLLIVAAAAGAQGAISTQGFGYPAGGLSTHGEAAGGGFGEFDFLSSRNPSALLGWARGGLYFQYDPEFRVVNSGSASNHTVTARFPLEAIAVQAGPRTIVSVSSSTFLDRTWATRVRGGQQLGTDSVGFEESVQSDGAINDLRLAAAVSITPSFSIGIGAHGYTGENRLHFVRRFDDSLKYGALDRQLTLGYLGSGLSFGATWRPLHSMAVAASTRRGGHLDMRIGDTVVATAHVPDRYGFSLRFDGLPGVSLGLSGDHTAWSQMASLSSTSLESRDGWEYGFGAEMTGPRMGVTPAVLYLGYRNRDLPFATTSAPISERVISTGASLPISGPRAVLDLALAHAARSSVAGVTESAWILSIGVTIRP